jgi:hypothetical protein
MSTNLTGPFSERLKSALYAAFYEGYIEGAHQPKGKRTIVEAKQRAAAFVAYVAGKADDRRREKDGAP